jgi:hypothetical protein
MPPVRWVTAEVLLLLHGHQCGNAGIMFTNIDLARWVGKRMAPEQRVHATSRLCTLGFLHAKLQLVNDGPTTVYTVTAEGAGAIAAAGAGHVRKSGPKGTRRGPPPALGTLAQRLWALVRVRRIVDSESAAQTLADAGVGEFASLRATVAKTLRRWELAGALAPRAKRVHVAGQPTQSNGVKGYVLLQDAPRPPVWTAAAKATAAAARATTGGAA